MIRTPVCRLFDIEFPLFQGGMAWVSDASLASAVSEGGGLGIISAMNSNADQVREEIRRCRTLTSHPFGVNIMLMSPYAADIAQLVIDEQVPVVATGAGMPTPYMKEWVNAGIQVTPVVPSTAVAKMVERHGATAVIAEGGESGGHVGDLTTMTLVPQVCDAVKIPVLAAGGIADGRGIAAALMLGAQGVQCGTRFLCAQECTIHPNYKKRILAAKDIDTIVTGKRLGHPVRALKNAFTRNLAEQEFSQDISNEELERLGAGALRKAAREGDEINGSFMAGQVAAMVHKEQPAAEIIREMFAEAEEILQGAKQWIE